MIEHLGYVNDPQASIFPRMKEDDFILSLYWDLEENWLESKQSIQIWALVIKNQQSFECVISDQLKLMEEVIQLEELKEVDHFLNQNKLSRLNLSQPLALEPVFIPKPWGQEIWYTGIEERGVCTIQGVPLPWLISLAPELITGQSGDITEQTPILLKTLDPNPDEIGGDLYFEMHEHKQEVYVVTHIDQHAWPDGQGAIKLGFDPEKVSTFKSKDEFLAAYQKAVKQYQQIRDKIDERLDRLKSENNLSLTEPVPTRLMKQWLKLLPAQLSQQEIERRKEMDSFVYLKSLNLGDVVCVPTHLPHSLQHGVRVIEFQSPHYERYILSFAQKVLTQNHWDTESALKKVELLPEESPITLVENENGCLIEEIVSFDTFKVWRVSLEANASFTLDLKTYVLISGVLGEPTLASKKLLPEQAQYVSALTPDLKVENLEKETATFLVAIPS